MAISSYIECAIATGDGKKYGRKATVTKAVKALKQIDFDTIVVRGVSGLIIGPIVAYIMGKKLCVIRKKEENSHAHHDVEYETVIGRYVILDDLMASGKTVEVILKEIGQTSASIGATWVGLYLYEGNINSGYDFIPSNLMVYSSTPRWTGKIPNAKLVYDYKWTTYAEATKR